MKLKEPAIINETVIRFQSLFENQLQLLQNPVCQTCDPGIKHPLLPWLVGDLFEETRERIVFIGKPHRGTPGDLLPSGILDPTSLVEGDDGLWSYSWPYWSYTREIAERLYKEEAFRSVAFTNIIKCTNTHDIDSTTPGMAQSCLTRLGVIWKELELLKPRTAIFYTYNLYPELLQDIPIAEQGSIEEIKPYGHRVPCGQKMLGWWERSCKTIWGEKLRILVVGHPERMKRVDYTNLISSWARTLY